MTTATAPPAIRTPAPLWTEPERSAWAVPPRLTPDDWAERYRVLPRSQSDRSGPWRNANAPYLALLMNLPVTPGVVRLSIMKAAQIGVSEALRNLAGYLADREPDPIGLTLPNKEKGREIVAERIIPMFRDTPILARLFTENAHDVKRSRITLNNGMRIGLMWSGSPAATASDPYRVVINDEVDKFTVWRAADATPVASTWVRLRTYGDRKCQINVSTPTTEAGQIFTLWEAADVQLYFVVPCPHCGALQRLVFPQLKYKHFTTRAGKPLAPKALAARIKRTPAAVWYECEHCRKAITAEQKTAMIRAGHWTTESGAALDAAGKPHDDAADVAEWPRATSIGVQISALYCLWESWNDIIAEFIIARGDLEKMFNFRTQTLGEPFEQQIQRTRSGTFDELSADAERPEGILPAWAAVVITTIDTQKDHFKAVTRAWGPTEAADDGTHDIQSARVFHGRIDSFKDLDSLLRRAWPFDNDAAPAQRTGFALIDTGGTGIAGETESRTLQVYRWAAPRQPLVRMIKGATAPRGAAFFWPGRGFVPSGPAGKKKPIDAPVWQVYTHHWNDMLAELIGRGRTPTDVRAPLWFLNNRNDAEYNQEMANMHKTIRRTRGKDVYVWVPSIGGAKYDFRHCEAYQIAAAWMKNLYSLLPPLDQWLALRARELEARAVAGKPKKKSEQSGSTRPQSPRRGGGAWTPSRW